jgi:hypothetical protein
MTFGQLVRLKRFRNLPVEIDFVVLLTKVAAHLHLNPAEQIVSKGARDALEERQPAW